MLAAGIVQDTFAGEPGEGSAGGEVETTGGYFCHQDRKFFPFRSCSVKELLGKGSGPKRLVKY